MGAKILTKATDLSKTILSQAIKEGDITVDATAGNGNDTLFLAQSVGRVGKVFAFDIQQTALEETKKKLEKHQVLHQVQLILSGHEYMDEYIKEKVSVVMFNLGYLPKADHNIVTKPETTIIALEKSIALLKPNGILSLAVYHGHKEGEEEKERILSYVRGLEQRLCNVLYMDFINQINKPPLLIMIEKK